MFVEATSERNSTSEASQEGLPAKRRESFFLHSSERHSQSSREGAAILYRMAHQVHSQWSVVRRHPYILTVPTLLFVLLCATGLALIFHVKNDVASPEEVQHYVQDVALEASDWYALRFRQATSPALALSQVVHTYADFRNLARRIGPSDQPDSLPLLLEPDGVTPVQSQDAFLRNVSGVCDSERVVRRFEEVAGPLITSSGVMGAIYNLTLAPQGVYCLAYPGNHIGDANAVVEEEEDSATDLSVQQQIQGENEGLVMTDFVDWGLDVMTSSSRWSYEYAEMVKWGDVQVRILRDDDESRDSVTLKIVFPVASEERFMRVEGQAYPRWGFCILYLDWNELNRNSPVVPLMQEEELEFRIVQVLRDEEGNSAARSVTLLESPGFAERKYGLNVIVVEVDTDFVDWKMEVAYEYTDPKPWRRWATIVCVVLSFCVSMVTYLVLLHMQVQAIAESEKTALVLESAKLSAKKERELNEFLAHEVRNPVSAAISACTFVSAAVHETEPLRDPESIQCVREDVNIIHTSLQFVNDLLRTMLDIHRADSKLLKVDRSATDVRMDIFDPVACMIQQHESFYRVEVECPEGLVIETDRMRLKQVILNLGRNSSKFVEKGFIRLRAVVENESDSLFLYVEDSGPGIPEEKVHRLFKKFQDSLDSLNQGTGVGLHLCRSLVELMNGEIWLDESYHSGVDGCPGARFVVRLDGVAILPSDSTAAETQASGFSDLELSEASCRRDDNERQGVPFGSAPGLVDSRNLPDQLRVLFVDDDTVLRKLFVRAVKKVRSEWIIEEAASGEAALRMAEQQSYDIIFIDQYMASVTKSLLGTETVRALRGKGVKTTICGLSANNMAGAFLAAGANTFSMKPFPCRKDELTAELLRIIYDSSLTDSAVPKEVL